MLKVFSFITLLVCCSSFASFEKDLEAIKKLTGCYHIDYEDTETFSPSSNYEFHERYKEKGLEWIFVEKQTEKEITLQHLLILPSGKIVKHWRQHWAYEDDTLYVYEGDNQWSYVKLEESIGRWTQATYQVDGGPRYECSAPWISWGEISYWECESPSPLPRREFSVRSDYNILMRKNRHEITSFGHVHSHDGSKINRTSLGDMIIAYEKGRNTYTRTEESVCAVAKEWWKKNERYWTRVHKAWDDIYAINKDFSIKKEVDGTTLMKTLFDLNDKSIKEEWDNFRIQKEVSAIIEGYFVLK